MNSDAQTLFDQIQEQMRPRRTKLAAERTKKELSPRKRTVSRRCACGSCRSCEEIARWERIFNEKFADPTYYTAPAIRMQSPLTSL